MIGKGDSRRFGGLEVWRFGEGRFGRDFSLTAAPGYGDHGPSLCWIRLDWKQAFSFGHRSRGCTHANISHSVSDEIMTPEDLHRAHSIAQYGDIYNACGKGDLQLAGHDAVCSMQMCSLQERDRPGMSMRRKDSTDLSSMIIPSMSTHAPYSPTNIAGSVL